MSIAMRWAERPDGIVGRAYEKGLDIIGRWASRAEHDSTALVGWPGVDLAEKIAAALLDAAGYDAELCDAAVDGDYPDGWSAADMDAEMERTRTVEARPFFVPTSETPKDRG